MKAVFHRKIQRFLLAATSLFIVFAFSGSVPAAPPGPGPKPAPRNVAKPGHPNPGPKPQAANPKPGPKPQAAKPKPGPKPQAAKPKPKPPGVKPHGPKPTAHHHPNRLPPHYTGPKYKYIHRHPRYYHPYYPRRSTYFTYSWATLGYPYYVGGTSYTLSSPPEPVSDNGATAAADVVIIRPPVDQDNESRLSTDEGDSAVACFQMQELTDLIHEWRTLNESPVFHERIAAASRSETNQAALDDIRQGNQDFDRASRSAMQKLIEGEKADSDLDTVRTSLEQLIQLAESLPEVPTSQAAP